MAISHYTPITEKPQIELVTMQSSSTSSSDSSDSDSDLGYHAPSLTCGYNFPVSKWVYRKLKKQRKVLLAKYGVDEGSSPSKVHHFPTLNDLPRINYRGNTKDEKGNNDRQAKSTTQESKVICQCNVSPGMSGSVEVIKCRSASERHIEATLVDGRTSRSQISLPNSVERMEACCKSSCNAAGHTMDTFKCYCCPGR